ncbi:MarR family transcriptional regulator [Sediminispirochaeta bajacaliforniensis]|uniref:MarR family transcriptional regulator n=1 Tax=Sediminispirochaeta bajacaliforniensis TaxID=148 RepID=UPI00037F7008|nr:MarR family transcriptional regulator [Sediminispirochaeta bajacaliforniensis]
MRDNNLFLEVLALFSEGRLCSVKDAADRLSIDADFAVYLIDELCRRGYLIVMNPSSPGESVSCASCCGSGACPRSVPHAGATQGPRIWSLSFLGEGALGKG